MFKLADRAKIVLSLKNVNLKSKNLFHFPKRFIVDYDPSKDYYKVLDIHQTANENEIKVSYYKLAKKYHPDLTKGQTTEKFKEINTAYEVLSDRDKKLQYDASRKFNSFWGGKTYTQQQQSRGGYQSYNQNYYANWNNFKGQGQKSYDFKTDEFYKGFSDWFKGFQDKYNKSNENYKSNFTSGKKYEFGKKFYEKNKDYFATFKRSSEETYQKPKPKKEATFGKKYYERNKKYYESFKTNEKKEENYNQNYNQRQEEGHYGRNVNISPFVMFAISFFGVMLGSIIIRRFLGGPSRSSHQERSPYTENIPREQYTSQITPLPIQPPIQTQSYQPAKYSSSSESTYNFDRINKDKSFEQEHGIKDDPFYRR